ncbi:MAG: hypothetical protein WKF58_07835 [Ilumatobacteraceae bacterium]
MTRLESSPRIRSSPKKWAATHRTTSLAVDTKPVAEAIAPVAT